MSEKIIIINDDLLPEMELENLSIITESDVKRIATELEQELPKELKGITNVRVQQVIQQIPE